jgi:hypothetical protein
LSTDQQPKNELLTSVVLEIEEISKLSKKIVSKHEVDPNATFYKISIL